MLTSVIFSCLLAFCFGNFYIIDDYSVDQSCSLTLNANLTNDQPNVVTDSFRQGSSKSIIGGERDMEMRVFTGSRGNRFTSDVNFGGWTVANPTSSSTSITTVQYDGVDGSFSLNITGLQLDFSSGSYLSLYTRSNGQSQITISLFDTTGGSCDGVVPIRISSSFQASSLPISQLSGNCNLRSIGAIETSIYSFTSINSTMERFTAETASSTSVSPTSTPTPSPSRANSNTETIVIDDCSVSQQAIVTLSEDLFSDDPNVVETTSMTGPSSSILGGERDMEMRVYTGFKGRRFASEVFPINNSYFKGEWAVENPKSASSLATNQYDGVDGSFALDISGLNNLDVSNSQLVFYGISDSNLAITFTFYDSMGGICDCVIGIPASFGSFYNYSYDEIKYVFNLNNLSGHCNKQYIGAIEYSIESTDTIDIIIKYFGIESLD